MKYYVIINGNSSLDIQGLAIESLPNISKPLIRTTREEIDGRDGDIITKLGYSAYDKTLNIGLWGNYDINEVIAFFNEDGVITFSNEPDKYYKFHILNRIDFVNQLEKFKKASITIHCQPFKYKEQEAKVIEEEAHTTSGTSFNLSDTLEAPLEIDLKGNTSQTGTPTPSSPIPINNVSGDNDIVVCGKNLFDKDNMKIVYGSFSSSDPISQYNVNVKSLYIPCSANTTYTISKDNTSNRFRAGTTSIVPTNGVSVSEVVSNDNGKKITLTTGNSAKYLIVYYWVSNDSSDIVPNSLQIEVGNQPSTYTPYTGTTYNIDLPVENFYEKGTIQWFRNNGTHFDFRDDNLPTRIKSTPIQIQCGKTYTISGLPSGITLNASAIYCYDANKDFLSAISPNTNGTFTLPSNVVYIQILCNGENFTSATNKLMNNADIQLELGSKSNTYTPYGTTPIELNKIGTYQDYIYKENDKWYLHKEVGKVVLDGSENWEGLSPVYYFSKTGVKTSSSEILIKSNYFKGTSNDARATSGDNIIYQHQNVIYIRNTPFTTSSELATWLTTHNTICEYVLETPTNTEITYTPLIEQLNTLEQAQSKEGTTNINQVNNDLPFIIDLTYYTGDTSITITNDGNIYSKPLLELKGTGNINIYLNGIQVFVVSLNDEIIYIDTDKMEAYYQGTLKNRQVVGDYNNFKLQSGNNTIQVDGGYVEYLKITNYSRWV